MITTATQNLTAKKLLNDALNQGIVANSYTGAALEPGEYTWLHAKSSQRYVIIATALNSGFDSKIGIYTQNDNWLSHEKIIQPFQAQPLIITNLTSYGVFVQNMSANNGYGLPKISFQLHAT